MWICIGEGRWTPLTATENKIPEIFGKKLASESQCLKKYRKNSYITEGKSSYSLSAPVSPLFHLKGAKILCPPYLTNWLRESSV